MEIFARLVPLNQCFLEQIGPFFYYVFHVYFAPVYRVGASYIPI